MVFLMDPTIENERRQTQRIRCQNAIEYRTLNPDQFQNNLMYDISEKGLSILINQWIPDGIPIAFQTKLAKNKPAIFGKGKTVWATQDGSSNKYRIGIEITELDKESLPRLAEFLQNNNKEQTENQT